MEDLKRAQLAIELAEQQLPHQTDIDKEILISLSEKVYTLLRDSGNIPTDVVEEFEQAIIHRDYYYLSYSCTKAMLQRYMFLIHSGLNFKSYELN